MNRSACRLFISTCLIAVLGAVALPANAQNAITFAFTGIITSVDDTQNFFQDTYALGAPISGSYTFSDSGFTSSILFGDPTVNIYDNFNDRNLTINAGPRQVTSGTNNLTITVANDTNDALLGPGDTYRVQNLLGFPAFFTDPSGDPIFDPDGFFLTTVFSVINLYDPTATALASGNLPLTPPNLSGFSQRTGSLFITDGNGELPNAAQVNFSIITLQGAQAAPEPGSLVFLALGGMLFLARRRRLAV